MKVRVGKLDADIQEIPDAIGTQSFELLPVDPAPLQVSHKDPFDHLLIAQAITEGADLVSDHHAPSYPVQVVTCVESSHLPFRRRQADVLGQVDVIPPGECPLSQCGRFNLPVPKADGLLRIILLPCYRCYRLRRARI